MSNPWKKVASPAETLNLSDIMCEEYARSIQFKEQEIYTERNRPVTSTSSEIPGNLLQVQGSDDDDVIAKIVQSDLDKEHNYIKTAMKQTNQHAKLTIAYSDVSEMLNLSITRNNASNAEDDDSSSNDWEYFDTEKEFTCTAKQSYIPKDNRMIVKHNIIASRRIAINLLDEPTRRILSKLIFNGKIKNINGVIYVGRKSIVLHGYKDGMHNKHINDECAIKIFNTARDKSSPRNKNGKDCVYQNAEKDGYYSRISYGHMGNVVIMKFYGKEQKPAPNLKDVTLTPEQWESAYKKVAGDVKLWYNNRLVHGNLVKNNVLWWENTCESISFSHSVRWDDPKFFQLLLHDCHNVCEFFKKRGVQNMKKSKEELFEWITGFEKYDVALQ